MVRIIIEGSSNTTNGDLRKGFHKLFSKALNKEFPFTIWMAGGKERAAGAFRDDIKSRKKFLLVDLDKPESERSADLLSLKLEGQDIDVFFMIQEMEGWFLSQPDKLVAYYSNYTLSIPTVAPKEIKNPKGKLKDITAHCAKKYHEVEDGAMLLQKLDPQKLAADFPEDFGRLIAELQKIQ